MEFGEKSLFVERAAAPQQFEKGIFGLGSLVAGRAQVDSQGDKRTWRSFQLRSGAGLAGEELDEFADALALFFSAGRELNAHAVAGMHNPNQAFGMNLHSGGAQAQVDGG